MMTKEERKVYAKAWLLKNKVAQDLKRVKYREDNKEKIRIATKLYAEKNKEKLKEAAKKWLSLNKDTVKAKAKRREEGSYKERRLQMNKRDAEKRYLRYKSDVLAFPEKHKQIRSEKYQKNKDAIIASVKAYAQRNRKKINAYTKKKRAEDLSFKIACYMRTRFAGLVKRGDKGKGSIDLLGCSIEFFKEYIAKQFKKGMSWENHGYKTWHLDHIIPCAKFDLTDPEQQKICFHYSNMQPLFAKENFSKQGRILIPVQTQLPLCA